MRRFLVPLLLVLSLLLNVLQYLHRGHTSARLTPPGSNVPAHEHSPAAPSVTTPAQPDLANIAPPPAPGGPDAPQPSGRGGSEDVLKSVKEDELVFGPEFSFTKPPEIHGETPPVVQQSRLKAAALEPPSSAEAFSIHAVIHLPGDRVLDLGESKAAPGHSMLLQKVREFPFPAGISLASPEPPAGSSQAMIPVTPAEFEIANVGIDLELDVTPAPGALVLGGRLRHRTFQAFGRMPGTLFSPVATEGTDESGKKAEVLLTENKVLQPQFMITESQILAAATDGQPIRISVKMIFGQTILELTCRSVPRP